MTLTLDKTGERLDAALARLVPSLSRSQAQRLIEQGAVTHGGRPVKKNEKLSAGDTLELTLPEVREVPIEAQPIPLEVCYEDADVIVVNKPKGLVVHPAPGHADGTLVNALLAHCGDSLSGIGGEKRPGIVHRIDKDTSGLIIAAKNDAAHAALAAQLKDHSLARTYVCLVCGRIRDDAGTIDAPIGRHPTARKWPSRRKTAAAPSRTGACWSGLRPIRSSSAGWRPGGRTRSASTWLTAATRFWATWSTATKSRSSGRAASACTRRSFASCTPARASR